MKNAVFFLVFLMFIFLNCNMTRQNEPDTVKKLMIGNWRLINGYHPQTDEFYYPDSDTFDIITFYENNSYKSITHVFKTSGIWELNQDKTRFRLIVNNSNTPFENKKATFDWIILKLDNDTLKYQIDRKGIHDKLIKTYLKETK